jgi:uncharacterized protein YcbK (DUF882 family)
MNFDRRQLLDFGFVSAAITTTALPLKGLMRAFGPAPALLRGPLPAATPTPHLVAAASPIPASAPVQRPASPAVIKKLAARLVRRAHVHNLHTGDVLDTVYYEDGQYLPDALAQARRVLRDWRNGEEHAMDAGLFDVLHAISDKIPGKGPFQILSGYRSKATNAMLHSHSEQVAQHSQHTLGKALDIILPGVELTRLRQAALSLKAGGVGFYPQSGFVHVDVGPVRQWVGA